MDAPESSVRSRGGRACSVAAAVKRRRNMRILWLAAALLIICLGIYAVPLFAIGAGSGFTVRVPRGATMQTLRDSVAAHAGEAYAGKVVKAAGAMGASFSLRHGAWHIEKGMSAARAAALIGRGAQSPVTLPLNNVRTPGQLAGKVSGRFDFSADEFLAALSDTALLAPFSLTPENAMALFIEDNYDFYWSATSADVVKGIGKYYNRFWNKERLGKAASLGLSPAEVMTLASIVDEETNRTDEKGRVGRLYINRLEKGMRLQADPTVRYAVGDFSIKRVTSEHLGVESPYNTYRHAGLPPGPIRTGKRATIDAILNSGPTDEIYMCAAADFSGKHLFTSSYSEHLQNARAYRAALSRREAAAAE